MFRSLCTLLLAGAATLSAAPHGGHASGHRPGPPSHHATHHSTHHSTAFHHAKPTFHYAKAHGTSFRHGYYYRGSHHRHWTYKYYWGRHRAWCYWCPSTCCWYYWHGGQSVFYPVSYIDEALPPAVAAAPVTETPNLPPPPAPQ